MKAGFLLAVSAGAVLIILNSCAMSRPDGNARHDTSRFSSGALTERLIPEGTSLSVRIREPLSTGMNKVGDRFTATLNVPVVVGTDTILDAGTIVTGTVRQVHLPRDGRGRALLSLALDAIETNNGILRLATTTNTRLSSETPASVPIPAIGHVTVPSETMMTFRLIRPAKKRS